MSKRLTMIALSSITLVGSFVTWYATQLLAIDIFNMQAGLKVSTLLSTFPALMLASVIVAAFLFVLRLYKRPNTFKSLSKLYLILNMAFSGVGFLTSLLSGAVLYHSFVKPYPFKGYLIIGLIVHLLILAASIYSFLMVRKFKDDEEKFKVDVKHVFMTIGWTLFIGLVFNRFGMLLVSPSYIYWRNFELTFPFYIYLAVPLLFGVYKMLVMFDVIKCKKARLIINSALLAVNLGLFIYIVIVGMKNTAFVSAISPAMPLDRMASMPIEIIIHFLAITAVGVILLVQALRKKEAKPAEELPEAKESE